jgi:putative heme-binding domain-containing protein
MDAASEKETRQEVALALAAIADPRAISVYLQGLTDRSPDLRRASANALSALRDQAAPLLDLLAARNELPPIAVPELSKIFVDKQPIMQWRLLGQFRSDTPPPFPLPPGRSVDLNAGAIGRDSTPVAWKLVQADNQPPGRVDLGAIYSREADQVAYGYAEVQATMARTSRMSVGSDDTLAVWVNGRLVYDFRGTRGFVPDQDTFEVALEKGTNGILVRCGNRAAGWHFGITLTLPGDYAFLRAAPASGGFDSKEYRAFAMEHRGDPGHGKALVLAPGGVGCIKCHLIEGQGGTVGPELTSIGAKYPRPELIESVLYPSEKLAQGYEPVIVATLDGRVITGIVKEDTAEALELEDAEARRIRIARDEIDERRDAKVSVMPDNLVEGLSRQDFADLIAYLESLRPANERKSAFP